MINELRKLNEKFYELYGRLYENNELLTAKQRELMANNLLLQYKSEYELLQQKTGIDKAREQYTVKQRRGMLIPKCFRFLFWKKKNYAAEQIDREIKAEITKYFDEREKALARLVEALDKENEQTPNAVNNEPQSPPETPQQSEVMPKETTEAETSKMTEAEVMTVEEVKPDGEADKA